MEFFSDSDEGKIYFYSSADSWNNVSPDVELEATIEEEGSGYLKILDNNGYIQIIPYSKYSAIVYKRPGTYASGMEKEIYFYESIKSWNNEAPDVTLNASIEKVNSDFIKVVDKDGYTQIIPLDKYAAIVYKQSY